LKVKKRIVFGLICIFLISGCSAWMAQQQNYDKATVIKAAYLDARIWYNDTQKSYLDYGMNFPIETKAKVNNILNECGKFLDDWKAALILGSYSAGTVEQWKQLKNRLIDEGILLFVK